MFKITQNTLRGFTFTEVLLMTAMNQLEAKRKAFGNEGSELNRCPYPEAAQLAELVSLDRFHRRTRQEGMSHES